MRTSVSELIDLALTQAIERYMEMERGAVSDAIAAEWPEQIAALLSEFIFNAHCANCGAAPDFIEMERDSGDCSYILPLCGCDWRGK
jgi:hypothetical protein